MQNRETEINTIQMKHLVVNDKRCCVNFLKNVIGRSNHKLYYSSYKKVDRQSQVDISILAWFLTIIPILDAIPNPALIRKCIDGDHDDDDEGFIDLTQWNVEESDEIESEAEAKRQQQESNELKQRRDASKRSNHKIWDFDEEYQVRFSFFFFLVIVVITILCFYFRYMWPQKKHYMRCI